MLKRMAAVTLATAFAAGGFALAAAPAQADVKSHGNEGVLNGNQVVAPVSVPVNVCGNNVAVLGVAAGSAEGKCAAGVKNDF